MQAKIDKTNYHIKHNNCHMSLENPGKFSFVMIGRVVSSGLQALFYLIFAAILDPQSYGNLNYLIALAAIFSIIFRFGLNHSATIYQAKKNTSLTNSINILALITTLVASIILLTFDIFAAALCFGMSLFTMNIHNLLGLKKYKENMILEIIRATLIISIPIGLYFVLDISGILLGMAISYFVCSFNFLKTISFKKNFSEDIKNNFKVLTHNFGVDFSTYAPRFVDKIIIFPILGSTTLGIYQLNIQLLFILEILPISLHSFLLSEESSDKKHKKIIFLVILTSIFIAILSAIVGPFFIAEFFPKYAEGITSLQILVFSIVPLTISAIISAKLQVSESTVVGYSGIVRVGSLLILIYILGSNFGLMGLSLSVLFSTVFHSIFLYMMLIKSSEHIQ